MKKAAAIARKKLKEAEQHVHGDKGKFYQVLLSCFDKYLMDKFSMDRNQLSKEKIRERLIMAAGGDLSKKTVLAIEGWEMKQYSPAKSINHSEDFKVAKDLIIELESRIKIS